MVVMMLVAGKHPGNKCLHLGLLLQCRLVLEGRGGTAQLARALISSLASQSRMLITLTQPHVAMPEVPSQPDSQEWHADQARALATLTSQQGPSGQQQQQQQGPPTPQFSREGGPPRPLNRRQSPMGPGRPGPPQAREERMQQDTNAEGPGDGWAQFRARNRQLTNLKQRQVGPRCQGRFY